MLDTITTFQELASIFHTQPDKMYSRRSLAQYIEMDKHFFWIWEDKIGVKNGLFTAHINGNGIKDVYCSPDAKPIWKNHRTRILQVLNSYRDYLTDGKISKLVHHLNNPKPKAKK